MKNIHILPTDKPSRLFLNKINNKLLLDSDTYSNLEKILPSSKYQNIYITSDEEIKEGWSYDRMMKSIGKRDNVYSSKIILTTDQDLIKNGVQAIDDEFLEWFVKNPSCEEVEVKKARGKENSWGYIPIINKIIIPKEEPKQETLEEAEITFANEIQQISDYDKGRWYGRIEGAKWQQERSYSDEEVIELLQKALTHKDNGETGNLITAQGEIRTANFYSWFEQFKKK